MNTESQNENPSTEFAGIKLTKTRVSKKIEGSGFFSIESIPISAISHLRARKKSFPIFIILAVLFIIASLFLIPKSPQFGILLLTTGFVLLLAFFATRKEVIEIISHSSTSISSRTSGANKKDLIDFIKAIDQTIYNFKSEK